MISMTVHVPKKLKTVHKKNDDGEVEEEPFDGEEGNGLVVEEEEDDDLGEEEEPDGIAKTSAPAVVAAKRKVNNAVKESNLAEVAGEDGEEDE